MPLINTPQRAAYKRSVQADRLESLAMLFVSVTLVMLVYTVISLCGGAFKDADIIGAIGAGCIVVTVVLMRAASRTRWL